MAQDTEYDPPRWVQPDNGPLKWGPPAVHVQRAQIEREKALMGPRADYTSQRTDWPIPEHVGRAWAQAQEDAARAEIGKIQDARAQNWAWEVAQREARGRQADCSPEMG